MEMREKISQLIRVGGARPVADLSGCINAVGRNWFDLSTKKEGVVNSSILES
jgi:hypothetical protein